MRLAEMMNAHRADTRNPRRSANIAFLALTLLGCATQGEPSVKTVTVKEPIPVPCAVAAPDQPIFADSDEAIRAAPDLFERIKLLLAGRIQRNDYIAALKAAVGGCAR